MATSGTRSFDLDIAEIVEEAFERCGLEVRSGYDLRTARRSLNLLFAEWAVRGMNLWTVKQTTLAMVADQEDYSLSTSVVDVLDVVLRRSGTDYQMQRISRSEYFNRPDKTSTGRPSQYFLKRTDTPVMSIWPSPETSTDTVVYYYLQRIEDAGAYTNTTDLPFRFLPALVAGLAFNIALKRAPDRVTLLKPLYEEAFQQAADDDVDRVPLRLTPGRRF